MSAMPWKLKSLQLNEFNLPRLREGDPIRIADYKTETEFTKPPDYLQESELISLMDQHGIGTDASIPQHMKNICDRHYVDVCGPGEDGQKDQVIQVNKGNWGLSIFLLERGGGRTHDQAVISTVIWCYKKIILNIGYMSYGLLNSVGFQTVLF